MVRIIGHLDMDAFFASVEEKYTPAFRGRPLVVGSDPLGGAGRGVVSTANYLARAYGIRSALPISQAWRLSEQAKAAGKPEVIFVTPDFEIYEKCSRAVFEIIKKYCALVEAASIDEFYFDLSFADNFKKAESICKKIKKEIFEKENLTCSVGIGQNKMISKIAAGINKPNGMLVVLAKNSEKFLEPLPIKEIPGVGPKTALKLNAQNIFYVSDAKKFSREFFKNMSGKFGEDLFFKIRGVDASPVVEGREVKSIGEQTTFLHNTLGALFVGEVLEELCKGVFERFKESGFNNFKTITITVRFSDFKTQNTSKSFKDHLTAKDFARFNLEALRLMLPYLDKRKNPSLKPIRLIGVRVENLSVHSTSLGTSQVAVQQPKSNQAKLF